VDSPMPLNSWYIPFQSARVKRDIEISQKIWYYNKSQPRDMDL